MPDKTPNSLFVWRVVKVLRKNLQKLYKYVTLFGWQDSKLHIGAKKWSMEFCA